MDINQKRINNIGKDLDKYLPHFVKDFQIFGIENIKKLENKQVIYLPNHLSLLDPVLILKVLNDFNLKHPATITGSNLNHWPLNKIIQESTGSIFINRKIMKSEGVSEEKRKELLKLNSKLEGVVLEGHNLLSFVESGRDYSGKVMERGDSGVLSRYLKISKKYKTEPFGCNVAIKYEPNTIENPCLYVSSFFKNKIEMVYFFTDIYAFLKNYISKKEKKPIAKINFGEPYPLKEFIENRDHERLLSFVKEDVKRLYKQIS